MPPCWIFNFQNIKFLTVGRVRKVNVRHGAVIFRNDRSNRCWDNDDFSIFQDGGRPLSWIRDARVWTTHDWKALGGLYRCANFGWNRYCTFEDMWVSTLCQFGLKMPIDALLGSFWGIIGVKGNFAVLSLYEYNNLRLTSNESNSVKSALRCGLRKWEKKEKN